MEYTIKNVKSFQGLEGHGFSCTLYRDGKKIGTVTDSAQGGMIDFFITKEEQEILDNYCKQFPANTDYGITTPYDGENLICKLVDDFEYVRDVKRGCKTKVIFTVDGDGKNQYKYYKGKFTKQMKKQIMDKNKGKNPVILNETIAGQVAV
jgi:hypothetical protein